MPRHGGRRTRIHHAGLPTPRSNNDDFHDDEQYDQHHSRAHIHVLQHDDLVDQHHSRAHNHLIDNQHHDSTLICAEVIASSSR